MEQDTNWKPTRMHGRCAIQGFNWFTAAVGFSDRSRKKIHWFKFGGLQIDAWRVRIHLGLFVYVD